MSERDPFEQLGDLIDQPVAPDARFAADLKAQLMSGLFAGNRSRVEENEAMDITFLPAPVALPKAQRRRIRPVVLLEIAAVAALLIGIAAAIESGRFSGNSDPGTTIPAAAVQDTGSPTPAFEFEPTVAPPLGVLWELPLPDGESLDFGGMTVHNGTIYRLLASPSFVGVEAVDARSGTIRWKTTHDWSGSGIAADNERVYFLSGPNERVVSFVNAVSASTGEMLWQEEIGGTLYGLTLFENTLYLDSGDDTIISIDTRDGTTNWGQFLDPTGPTDRVMVAPGSESVRPIVTSSYVAGLSATGVLTVMDRDSGEEIWHQEGFNALNTHVEVAGEVAVVWTYQNDGPDAGTPLADAASRTPGSSPSPNDVTGSQVLGLSLSDGSKLWSHEISGPVTKSKAIGSTVAYVSLDVGAGPDGATRSPRSNMVSGLDAFTGEPVWSIDAGDQTLILLGTWSPAEGGPAQFVVAAEDGSLMVVDPGNQGRSTQLATTPGQPPISEPQGDQHGIYFTLQDGTLVAVAPTALAETA